MAGHLFVTQGDITTLACDAWLLPSDANCSVTAAWFESVPGLASLPRSGRELDIAVPRGWDDNERVLPLPVSVSDDPTIWLANVGSVKGEPVAWYANTARQFLEAFAATRNPLPRRARAKCLVALPLIGTGAGGGHRIKGEVLVGLIEALDRATAELEIDAVLVTNGAAAHAAAQAIRLRDEPTARWNEVAELIEDAEDLARLARAGRLVLFLGAGIGLGAGLPDWNGLLDRLRETATISDEDWEHSPAVLDRARLLESRLGGPDALARAVAEAFSGRTVSLAHTQVAALPVQEVATTNYDRLFELAAHGVGRPAAALPYEPASRHGGRWVLHMHGTIDETGQPRDIVLTRSDYLSYASRRAALSGIVQALLLTRHMLFVGFSLTDDNFLRILHEVRAAVGDQGSRPDPSPFGTALTPARRPPDDLWQGDVRWVSTLVHDDAASARRIELFLDLLLALATDTSAFLLRYDFRSVLDDRGARLAAVIGRFAAALSAERLTTLRDAEPATALLARYGAPDRPPGSPSPPLAAKGSRRRMQELVESGQDQFEAQLRTLQTFAQEAVGRLRWLSPLAENGYREIRDDLWRLADLAPPSPQADGYWPSRGPVWDGVAVVSTKNGNGVILVEAKSHESELASPGTAASRESRATIERTLEETKARIGVASEADWTATYFQIANRLAFLHYLRIRRRIPAWLVFVYFIADRFPSGDTERVGPATAEGWTRAIADAERALGLPSSHPLSPWIQKQFVEVSN